jgi:alanine racemase
LPTVWLKLNSGMNRLGFSIATWSDAVRRTVVLQNCEQVRSIGIMSHFARADDAEGIGAAMKVWKVAESQARTLYPVQTCLANSAAALRYHGVDADWIRCGIALYGATPFSWTSQADGASQARTLTPSMGLYSQIIAVQEIRAGEQVGYGGSFVATKAMRLGVVACGYADGYPRSARSGTPVLVHGLRCPTAGRVSMDMLTIDLSNAPNAKVGSPVELWGRRLSIDEVADNAQTIGYELMCALAARVPTRLGALHG